MMLCQDVGVRIVLCPANDFVTTWNATSVLNDRLRRLPTRVNGLIEMIAPLAFHDYVLARQRGLTVTSVGILSKWCLAILRMGIGVHTAPYLHNGCVLTKLASTVFSDHLHHIRGHRIGPPLTKFQHEVSHNKQTNHIFLTVLIAE